MPTPRQGRDILAFSTQQQYNNWLVKETERVLLDAYRRLVKDLAANYASLTIAQRRQLATAASNIQGILGEAYSKLASWHEKQMARLALVEGEIARAELASFLGPSMQLGSLSPAMASSIASMSIEGLPLGEWWQKAAREMTDEVRRNIQTGLLRGETTAQIARRIVPTRGSVDVTVYRRALVRAQTLIRTTTTAVQNQAALATYIAQGSDITDRFEFSATMDGRTSDQCRGFDGRIFRYSDARAPIPPLHPNCRSTVIPLLNMRRLPREVREYARSQGVSTSGQLPAPPGGYRNYEEWLRARSPAVQDDILGRGRGQLFRERNIPLREMIMSDGRTLTLEALRSARLGVL